MAMSNYGYYVLQVPWTKLKSEPIVITLDCVEIQVETCEQLRNVVASTRPSYTSGRYGFAEQTLDSITVVVNSVNIHLRSPAFEATLDVSSSWLIFPIFFLFPVASSLNKFIIVRAVKSDFLWMLSSLNFTDNICAP